MKKRIVTLLLVLCLAFSAAPVALAADEDQNQDYIAFYLTQYELQAGDTMSAVCKNRDINFANYMSIIQNVNNISNFNYLIAGRKYWLPAKSVGSATNYYAVYRHTLVAGDTVGALCTKYGISLSENEKLIKQLNGNPKNLSSFYVGTPIYIPVPSGKVGSSGGTTAPEATTPPTTGGTVTPPTTGGTTTTPPAATTPPTGSQNSDYVAFYLTRHKLEKGDNLSNVCSRRGISFSKYKTLIQNVNKISNFNYLIAGREYWVPATTPGAATEYYTVYSHMLLPGDTVYNLCTTYGISMSKNEDMIKKLNGNPKNLTSFKANTVFYIPVYTEKAAGSTTVVPGTGTLPGDAANAGTGTGTTTSTTVTNPDGSTTTTTTTTTTTIGEKPNLFNAVAAAKYYLIPYTVKSGDTLVGICNEHNTSFSKNAEIIALANGLSSYSNITVGTRLWIPTNGTFGFGATEYYTVTNYTMKKGDTVYSVCKAAGTDFSSSYKMLTTLNPNVNFNYVMVGDKLAIPAYTNTVK